MTIYNLSRYYNSNNEVRYYVLDYDFWSTFKLFLKYYSVRETIEFFRNCSFNREKLERQAEELNSNFLKY